MKLDFFSYKFDSFDRTSFSQEALSYSSNSLLIFFNFEEIFITHQPKGIKNIPKKIKIKFFSFNNKTLQKIFLPIFTLSHYGLVFFFSLYICLRYRPNVVWTETPYAGLAFVIAKKLKLCKKFVFCAGDWLLTGKKRSLLSYVNVDIIWLYSDLICSKTCDLLLSYTQNISDLKKRHWKRKVAKLECIHFPPTLQINSKIKIVDRPGICFMGQVKEVKDFDIILTLLPELNRKYGVKLVVLGPVCNGYTELINLTKKLGVEKYTSFYPWVNSEKIHELMEKCFCGINLITSQNSYAQNTIPGKLMHYIQMLIPPIVTKENGPFADVIQGNDLGLVVEPSRTEIKQAIEKLFVSQAAYQEKITKYTANQNSKSLQEYLDLI